MPFSDIPKEGLCLSVSDVGWFPESEVTRRNNPEIFVTLSLSGERVFVEGSIKVTLAYQCDRCLEEFVCPEEIKFQLFIEIAVSEGDNPQPTEVEYEYDSGQIEVVNCENRLIDLGEVLYQQVLLALPLKKICRNDCRGICERCGAALNSEPCNCTSQLDSSPFASLKKFHVKS